jgi:hypothetical protein
MVTVRIFQIGENITPHNEGAEILYGKSLKNYPTLVFPEFLD